MGVMTLHGITRPPLIAVLTMAAFWRALQIPKGSLANVPAILAADQAAPFQMPPTSRITYGELHLRHRGRTGGVRVQL